MSPCIGRAAALSILAVGAFAAPAGADTFCVGSAPGCFDTVQPALDAAGAAPGNDIVQIAAGTFTGASEYSSGSGAVDVRGAGAGETKLTAPASGLPVLALTVPGSKASSLQIDKKGSAFGVSLGSAALEDARITGDYQSGGIWATGASAIRRTEVDLTDGVGISLGDGGDATVEGGSVRAHLGILVNKPTGKVLVRRLRSSTRMAAQLGSGTLRIENSLMTIEPGPGAIGLLATSFGTEVALEARHVTLVHPAPQSAGSQGVLMISKGGGSASVKLRDSVLDGFETDLVRKADSDSAGSSLDIAWTRMDPKSVVEKGVGAITLANTTVADPAFVDRAAGNYALRSDSPLVDAGDPAGPAPGDPLVDLAGHPRYNPHLAGGAPRSDLGALETAPLVPAPPVTPPPPTPTPPTPPPPPTAPAVSALKVAPKKVKRGNVLPALTRSRKRSRIELAVSKPSRLTFRFRRRLDGRWKSVHGRIAIPASRIKAGTVRVRFAGRLSKTRWLKPGAYRVQVIATDASGNRSKPVAAAFRLRR